MAEVRVLVDDARGVWPRMAHAPWDGYDLGDFVMAFFLFIVGMAIPLKLKRVLDRFMAIRKVITQTLKLPFCGILLEGGYSHAPEKLSYGVEMPRIRWCGILQRIALAYLAVSLVEIFTKSSRAKDELTSHFSLFRKYSRHWLFGACVLIAFLSVLYVLHVPDWHFTVDNPDSDNYGKVFSEPLLLSAAGSYSQFPI